MTGSVAQPHPNAVRDPDERWRILLVLGLAELLAMSPWFSASAVAPLLIGEWGLADLDVPLLTVTVQLGFVAGALLLSLTGAVDVVRGRVLFLAGASLAAAANLGFAYVASDLASALPFRFLTGFALAGVYPFGMKILPAGSAWIAASPSASSWAPSRSGRHYRTCSAGSGRCPGWTGTRWSRVPASLASLAACSSRAW